MKPVSLTLAACLCAACLSAACLSSTALAQAAADERFGIVLGGIPPFFMSAGAYTSLARFGENHLEARVLGSYAAIPTFLTALGAEADLLLSHPFANGWRVYGGAAAAYASTSVNGGTNYYGLGGLVGLRGGRGFGLFAEVGAVTFFNGVSGPLARLGVQYSF